MTGPGTAIRLDAPSVIVTGSNGWLGRRVVEALTVGLEATRNVSDGGHRVRCLVLPNDDASMLQNLGAEIVVGDVCDEAAVASLVAGQEGALLLHIAGVIHPRRVSDFEEINTRGTLRVLKQACRAGIRRMVVMSSNSPIGCNPYREHRFTEDSPYNPYMGYGRSKWLMELALRDMMGVPSAPEIVIVRAPWFYGPGQPARQTLFFTMIKDGSFPLVGDGSNRRSMAYVDNLAQGILLAAAHPSAAGNIYWLADETPYSMLEIVDTVRSVLGDDFGLAGEREDCTSAVIRWGYCDFCRSPPSIGRYLLTEDPCSFGDEQKYRLRCRQSTTSARLRPDHRLAGGNATFRCLVSRPGIDHMSAKKLLAYMCSQIPLYARLGNIGRMLRKSISVRTFQNRRGLLPVHHPDALLHADGSRACCE